MLKMISEAEIAWLSALQHRNLGAWVEIGTFLGASTLALKRDNNILHTFDRFLWDEYMQSQWPEHGYRVGDSFFLEYVRNVGLDGVCPHIGDIERASWSGPIELLFIDAMKTIHSTIAIARKFFPWLMTGGRLIEQDFRHAPVLFAYKYVLFYKLREHLKVRERCNSSVMFDVIKPIPQDLVDDVTHAWFAPQTFETLRNALDYYQDALL